MSRRSRVLKVSIALLIVLLSVIGGAALLARLVFNSSGLATVAAMHRAVERGRVEHAVIKRFDEHFGAGEHSISYFSGEYGPSAWNSRWLLAKGRYELHITFPVSINGDRTMATGRARLQLFEIDLAQSTDRAIFYTGNQHEFDIAVDDETGIDEARDRINRLIK